MKIICIGDVHGRKVWKDIITQENPDKVVFIGDYWDSFDIPFQDQMKNFLEIVHYKVSHPNTVLLLGNHDFHYTRFAGEFYSGYQQLHQYEIAAAIDIHKQHFQVAHQEENILFTHAGLTKTWWEANKEHAPRMIIQQHKVAEHINDIYEFTPRVFRFTGPDSYGENITESPLWVRPHALRQDAFPGLIQVVGHTAMNIIKRTDGTFPVWFIDVLDRTNEYLVITDGVFEVERLPLQSNWQIKMMNKLKKTDNDKKR